MLLKCVLSFCPNLFASLPVLFLLFLDKSLDFLLNSALFGEYNHNVKKHSFLGALKLFLVNDRVRGPSRVLEQSKDQLLCAFFSACKKLE
jgi:hypothetical protein